MQARRPRAARAGLIDELIRDPARALAIFLAELERAWERLLAPFWPRLLALLEADIAHRSGVLATHGLRGALAGLHPSIHATADRSRSTGRGARRARPRRGGPAAGAERVRLAAARDRARAAVAADADLPVRGVAELWRDRPGPPGGLGRLLGEARAVILDALAEPSRRRRSPARSGARRRHLGPSHGAARRGSREGEPPGPGGALRAERARRGARRGQQAALIGFPGRAHTNLTWCSSRDHTAR